MAEMGDRASSSSTATRRFAQLYQVDEAQILLENLPSDLSDEEPDSDPEDATYEEEPTMRK